MVARSAHQHGLLREIDAVQVAGAASEQPTDDRQDHEQLDQREPARLHHDRYGVPFSALAWERIDVEDVVAFQWGVDGLA